MEPNNVKTVFIYGKESINKILLFKFAINLSENGCNVLYISNKPISSIPDQLRCRLVKDTLKKIIFMYFEQTSNLLAHCAELNKSSFVPQVIIIDVFDQFCNLNETDTNFNIQKAAFVCAVLLSSIAICARRINKCCYLIISCDKHEKEDYFKRIKLLVDLYFFKNVWFVEDETEIQHTFEAVMALCQT